MPHFSRIPARRRIAAALLCLSQVGPGLFLLRRGTGFLAGVFGGQLLGLPLLPGADAVTVRRSTSDPFSTGSGTQQHVADDTAGVFNAAEQAQEESSSPLAAPSLSPTTAPTRPASPDEESGYSDVSDTESAAFWSSDDDDDDDEVDPLSSFIAGSPQNEKGAENQVLVIGERHDMPLAARLRTLLRKLAHLGQIELWEEEFGYHHSERMQLHFGGKLESTSLRLVGDARDYRELASTTRGEQIKINFLNRLRWRLREQGPQKLAGLLGRAREVMLAAFTSDSDYKFSVDLDSAMNRSMSRSLGLLPAGWIATPLSKEDNVAGLLEAIAGRFEECNKIAWEKVRFPRSKGASKPPADNTINAESDTKAVAHFKLCYLLDQFDDNQIIRGRRTSAEIQKHLKEHREHRSKATPTGPAEKQDGVGRDAGRGWRQGGEEPAGNDEGRRIMIPGELHTLSMLPSWSHVERELLRQYAEKGALATHESVIASVRSENLYLHALLTEELPVRQELLRIAVDVIRATCAANMYKKVVDFFPRMWGSRSDERTGAGLRMEEQELLEMKFLENQMNFDVRHYIRAGQATPWGPAPGKWKESPFEHRTRIEQKDEPKNAEKMLGPTSEEPVNTAGEKQKGLEGTVAGENKHQTMVEQVDAQVAVDEHVHDPELALENQLRNSPPARAAFDANPALFHSETLPHLVTVRNLVWIRRLVKKWENDQSVKGHEDEDSRVLGSRINPQVLKTSSSSTSPVSVSSSGPSTRKKLQLPKVFIMGGSHNDHFIRRLQQVRPQFQIQSAVIYQHEAPSTAALQLAKDFYKELGHLVDIEEEDAATSNMGGSRRGRSDDDETTAATGFDGNTTRGQTTSSSPVVLSDEIKGRRKMRLLLEALFGAATAGAAGVETTRKNEDAAARLKRLAENVFNWHPSPGNGTSSVSPSGLAQVLRFLATHTAAGDGGQGAARRAAKTSCKSKRVAQLVTRPAQQRSPRKQLPRRLDEKTEDIRIIDTKGKKGFNKEKKINAISRRRKKSSSSAPPRAKKTVTPINMLARGRVGVRRPTPRQLDADVTPPPARRKRRFCKTAQSDTGQVDANITSTPAAADPPVQKRVANDHARDNVSDRHVVSIASDAPSRPAAGLDNDSDTLAVKKKHEEEEQAKRKLIRHLAVKKVRRARKKESRAPR
ncbi:unnamed protein product [Amoebophrya sp. A120]|nr:unnamed protein product [Amoebophrya sp. A120]|eukprot:GSA120T00006759001.1